VGLETAKLTIVGIGLFVLLIILIIETYVILKEMDFMGLFTRIKHYFSTPIIPVFDEHQYGLSKDEIFGDLINSSRQENLKERTISELEEGVKDLSADLPVGVAIDWLNELEYRKSLKK